MTSTSSAAPDWDHAIFLGNINRELEHNEVKDQVLQLLLFLGITIGESDLEVRYSKTSAAYITFINLGRRDMQKYVYDSLSKDSQRLVDGLVQDGRRLKVDYYRKLSDRRSGTSDRANQIQNTNQYQLQSRDQNQDQNQVQMQNQSSGENADSLDLSLEVLGRSIQMESRASRQSNTYEPHQAMSRSHLSNNRGRQDQVTVQGQPRSVPIQNQVQSPSAGEAVVNQGSEQVQVQAEIHIQPSEVDPNQDRSRPDGVSVESEEGEVAGPSLSTQVVALPQSNNQTEDKPAVTQQQTRQQTDHGQSTQTQKKRRKKRRARPSNQQRYIDSSDSESDDRVSTGTFTLEEGESFLNKTYPIENDQSYLGSLPTPANKKEPRGASPASRPPSRLPRLKNRPPKTENPGGLKKLSSATTSTKEETSTSQQPVLPKRPSSPSKRQAPRANSNASSNGGHFYTVGQKLGSESRHLEFKAGGGDYLKKFFKEHIGRYICAFLNSEGGTLMIGVADDGSVQGVHCDQIKEDRIRRDIDSVIRHFKPQVFTEMYTVDFVPVKNQRLGPLKVIKITVRDGISDTLYENDKGEVYLRRDGSVQGPLKAHEIKEWCRLHHQKEIDVMKQRERDLEHEMELQKEMEAKLRSDLTKYQKSKVCNIL